MVYGRAELQYNLVMMSNTPSKCNRVEKEAVVYAVDVGSCCGNGNVLTIELCPCAPNLIGWNCAEVSVEAWDVPAHAAERGYCPEVRVIPLI
jgi:hypothetical protein